MSQATDLHLTPTARARLLHEASQAYPAEACGALLGSADCVVGLHPLTNRALNPRDSFEIDPVELEPLLRGEADGGLPLLGFYHSHPNSGPIPSTRDLDEAWPGYWYVIVGVRRGVAGTLRAWRTRDEFAGSVGSRG